MNINHLHFKVRSVDRARRFYETFFGLHESARHGDIPFLRDEAGMDSALAPTSSPVEPPPGFHFGFRLGTEADVERLYETLTNDGVEVVQPLERVDGLVSFRCTDPDGYAIEVYWEPPTS